MSIPTMDATPRRYQWTTATLPRTRITLDLRAPGTGFAFTPAMVALCRDIAARVPDLARIDMNRVLVTAVMNRRDTKHGLMARVTPLRFKAGALTQRRRGWLFGLERHFVDDVEMLYLLTFVLPRFLNQSPGEKLATVIHELYHMSAEFNGDFRRHAGRYSVHSHSKDDYHDKMHDYAKAYRQDHPHPETFAFLERTFHDYQQSHGGVTAIIVPQPKMVPITRLS